MSTLIAPSADGFGKNVTGGRNGLVLFINSLSDAESRTAWQGEFPRMIIPRVSGYVELSSILSVGYSGRNNFTYLGFLAPGELVYKNWEIRVSSVFNFAIRGLKSRPGDRNKEVSLVSGDAFAFSEFSGSQRSNNFYIDHSVGSWSTDEVFSIGSGEMGTVQYCLFYEPLHLATVRAGNQGGNSPHGYGHIFGSKNLSFHHNFHAYMHQRMPTLQNNQFLTQDIMDFRNNAYYAWDLKGFVAGENNKMVNVIKNSFTRKINYTGVSPLAMVRFRGSTIEETPRVYMQGNQLRHWNGSSYINTVSGLTDDPSSQRQTIFAEAGNEATTNLRNTVGVLDPFPIPPGTYSFERTVAQSDLSISLKAGTLRHDPVDRRVINDWLTGAVPIQGGTTGIWGLIDKPEDSKHLGSTNVGYPVIESRAQVLDGPAPHYLPSWFISKYNLINFGNYHLAGNSATRPENFIRFVSGVGIQLSQDTRGTIDHINDIIYRGYEVIAFHETGEINLLESATFSLTINSTVGGSSNITGGSFAPSSSINLIATPDQGFSFTRWEIRNNITLLWETISGATANFNYIMPSANTIVRPIFTVIPTYTLSVSSTENGTTNITTATATAGQPVALTAIPNSGYRYDKWERLEGVAWVDLLALQSFNFIMPDANTSVRASFVLVDEPPIPPIVTGDRFFARFE